MTPAEKSVKRLTEDAVGRQWLDRHVAAAKHGGVSATCPMCTHILMHITLIPQGENRYKSLADNRRG